MSFRVCNQDIKQNFRYQINLSTTQLSGNQYLRVETERKLQKMFKGLQHESKQFWALEKFRREKKIAFIKYVQK